MLYTTYLSKIKKIPENVQTIVITRFPPQWVKLAPHKKTDQFIKIENIKNGWLVKDLAPYEKTLLDHKEDGDWEKYVERFTEQMNENPMKNLIERLIKALESGKDICLVCFCKDIEHCHRGLLAKDIVLRGKNIEHKEID